MRNWRVELPEEQRQIQEENRSLPARVKNEAGFHVDLIDEPDGEGVTEEREEKEGEEGDVLESHHELAVTAVECVVQWLLQTVGNPVASSTGIDAYDGSVRVIPNHMPKPEMVTNV
ncbi:uncharacterized protein G2W53_031134 [Senna tora]|uniref:Uncharacterized protein n=1 Tax=Senna tora TaxID=362788 RepID=A0A834T8H5_9FABA|nr:uncharacterized protein G2W53_031134 [Senna tora]